MVALISRIGPKYSRRLYPKLEGKRVAGQFAVIRTRRIPIYNYSANLLIMLLILLEIFFVGS